MRLEHSNVLYLYETYITNEIEYFASEHELSSRLYPAIIYNIYIVLIL